LSLGNFRFLVDTSAFPIIGCPNNVEALTRRRTPEHQEYQILLSLYIGADRAGELLTPQTPGFVPLYKTYAELANVTFGSQEHDGDVFGLCVDEWSRLLSVHGDFEDCMSNFDGSICTPAELAAMITAAPTATMRQVAREMVYCRQQLALALGYAFQASDEEQSLFNQCEDEWQDLLAQFPKFHSWLVSIDRFTCSREILLEAIRRAPAIEIRQALREMYCFRETAALANSSPF